MRLLLDTCTAVWAALEPERLSAAAAAALEESDAPVLVSAASVWEVAIREASRRHRWTVTVDAFMRRLREDLDAEWLPIDERAAAGVGRLPLLHRDPFDRILVAQAIEHGLTIVTPDADIGRYPATTLW